MKVHAAATLVFSVLLIALGVLALAAAAIVSVTRRALFSADAFADRLSASLGDPISPGSQRLYQVYYRDPDLPCAFEPNYNATQGLSVLWHP